jgi:hypothetical protein
MNLRAFRGTDLQAPMSFGKNTGLTLLGNLAGKT